MRYKLSLPLLSLRTVNTVTDSYHTSAFVPLLLLVKNGQIPGRRLQVSTIFLHSFVCKIYIQTPEWTPVLKAVKRHILIFHYDKIPLKFLLHFFGNLTFVPI